MTKGNFMKHLKPHLYVESLQEIELEYLWSIGKRGIILDVDNTIAPWRDDRITAEAHEFINEAIKLKYKVCLLSNASQKRVEKAADVYCIPFVAPALKPRSKAFKRAAKVLGLKSENVVMIGDQIFTDILGGNRAGCHTILVKPINNHEFIGTKLMRKLERLTITLYDKLIR